MSLDAIENGHVTETKTVVRSKRRKSTAAANVPQTRQEAADAIGEIGKADRDLVRIEADMNDAIAEIKERYEAQAEPLRSRISNLTVAVQTWAEANRDELTQKGKTKTVQMTTGEILWRYRPPSVRIVGVQSVIGLLRRLGMGRFVRVREEVNREAILAEPRAVDGVPGIFISQSEDFVIQPFSSELSEVA